MWNDNIKMYNKKSFKGKMNEKKKYTNGTKINEGRMICTKKRKGREIFVHLYVNDNRHLLIHTNTKKRNVVALLLFFISIS